MVFVYFSPEWFYGYHIAMELLFAVVSLLVSLLAFRVYRKTSQKPVKLFGAAFLLISASYFIQSLLNFSIVLTLNATICYVLKIESVETFNNIGMFVHIIFMTAGLITLLYTTLRIEKLRVLWLLIFISLTAILLSGNILFMFYLLSSIYLALISWHYATNFLRKRQIKTLLVSLAFVFLLFGHFHFLLMVNHEHFNVLGLFLEFFAYIMIIANLYLVLKK